MRMWTNSMKYSKSFKNTGEEKAIKKYMYMSNSHVLLYIFDYADI